LTARNEILARTADIILHCRDDFGGDYAPAHAKRDIAALAAMLALIVQSTKDEAWHPPVRKAE